MPFRLRPIRSPPYARLITLADFAHQHALTLIAKEFAAGHRPVGKVSPVRWYAGFENVSEETRAGPVPLQGNGATPWEAFAHYAQVISGKTLRITCARHHHFVVAPALLYRDSRWAWPLVQIERSVARWCKTKLALRARSARNEVAVTGR